MTGGGPEMAFTVLSHIRCLAERCSSVFTGDEAGVFDEEYKKFFCRSMLMLEGLHWSLCVCVCVKVQRSPICQKSEVGHPEADLYRRIGEKYR